MLQRLDEPLPPDWRMTVERNSWGYWLTKGVGGFQLHHCEKGATSLVVTTFDPEEVLFAACREVTWQIAYNAVKREVEAALPLHDERVLTRHRALMGKLKASWAARMESEARG